MRAVVQRVSKARVTVEERITGAVAKGLVVLLAVHPDDSEADLEFMKRRLLNLRIFSDDSGKFNLSLLETGGGVLLVSQFTLFGDCRKGNRPSFSRAAPPEKARALYERMRQSLIASGIEVATGVFGAHMEVDLVNDGPVTLIIDSRKEIY